MSFLTTNLKKKNISKENIICNIVNEQSCPFQLPHNSNYGHNLLSASGREYLKHSEEGLGKVVKGTPLGLRLIEVELSTKHLHAQQGEDDDEEEEQQQQGSNGLHGVEKRCHQVTERLPMTVEKRGAGEGKGAR